MLVSVLRDNAPLEDVKLDTRIVMRSTLAAPKS
jgi:hypothetical protein